MPVLMLLLLASADVRSQHLGVRFDPPAHTVEVVADLQLRGEGPLRLELADEVVLGPVLLDGSETACPRTPGAVGAPGRLEVNVPGGARRLHLSYTARFEDDVAAGERAGAIHNFSVHAHVSEQGVFLSDGAAWYPRPLGPDGHPALIQIRTAIVPIPGWAFVASGDPAAEASLSRPCWLWSSPRPVDGCAIAGNRHRILGRVHRTPQGPVEIVMQVAPEHRDLAPLFLDAAAAYLDLYTPLLGPFPYRRFTIVENFFSSGFAFPGFTLLGPQVVAMAPRSLAPGYLDHELVHNWWGNGVYVDPEDGNWSEGLTSFCANYFRRVTEGGEEAGRAYRRGTLMKLSADPGGLDDGPLGDFGSADPSAGGPGRFVGYEKGAFVFIMLQRMAEGPGPERGRMWAALRRFAGDHLGRRAGWADLQAAFETELDRPLGTFFRRWVRQRTRPVTPGTADAAALGRLQAAFADGPALEIRRGADAEGPWIDVDPDFRCYRILPPEQIVPLIGGTLGPGGVRVESGPERAEVTALGALLEPDPQGENLLLIGAGAIAARAALIARTADPITVAPGGASFTVGGTRYKRADQAVLHTMAHPDRKGRFITVFHSNGDAGWAKLPLIVHYARDTTIVWEDSAVRARRTFQPDRKLRPGTPASRDD